MSGNNGSDWDRPNEIHLDADGNLIEERIGPPSRPSVNSPTGRSPEKKAAKEQRQGKSNDRILPEDKLPDKSASDGQLAEDDVANVLDEHTEAYEYRTEDQVSDDPTSGGDLGVESLRRFRQAGLAGLLILVAFGVGELLVRGLLDVQRQVGQLFRATLSFVRAPLGTRK